MIDEPHLWSIVDGYNRSVSTTIDYSMIIALRDYYDDPSYAGHVGTMSYITGRELDLIVRKSQHKSMLLYDGSISCNVLIRSTTVVSQWFIQ